jgi:hypothetical protein
MNKLAAIAIFFSLGLTVPANATVWSFTGSGNSLTCATPSTPSTCNSFASGGITIYAAGYNNASTNTGAPALTTLYQNSNGIGVTGGTGPNEITDASFVELNLSSPSIANGTILSLSIYGANSSNEYDVYESSSAPNPSANPNGTSSNFAVLSANDTSTTFVFTKSASDNYIAIEVPTAAGSTSSVELTSLTTVAPEPGYYGLLSLGLSGLGFAAFRRRQRLVADSTTVPSKAV